MQVSIKMIPMKRSADDMRQIRRKIDTCESELTQIRRELASLSGMGKALERIQKCEKNMEEQSRHCLLFGTVLEQICFLYEKNENGLIDYSENTVRKAQREPFVNASLRELYSVLKKAVYVEGGR